MMPVMDGWQFVAELDRRGKRKAPLLILSADRAVQGHASKLRADAYLAKPSDLDDLLGKSQQLTGGAHGPPTPRSGLAHSPQPPDAPPPPARPPSRAPPATAPPPPP